MTKQIIFENIKVFGLEATSCGRVQTLDKLMIPNHEVPVSWNFGPIYIGVATLEKRDDGVYATIKLASPIPQSFPCLKVWWDTAKPEFAEAMELAVGCTDNVDPSIKPIVSG